MEAVYQLLKSEFRKFGSRGISLVLALTALLFLMAEWKRLSRGCRMYTAYAACMLVLVGNPFGYNDISTFWMETSYSGDGACGGDKACVDGSARRAGMCGARGG